MSILSPYFCIAALFILGFSAHAQPAPAWRLTQSEHFELYSQGDDTSARSALIWFEQLRAFYLQKTGLAPPTLPPVRVIGFRSAREYQPYRLQPASDAHYIGTEGRDYIVMATIDAGQFGIAAHEYAHSILRAAGLRVPPWFSEGLAEFFSTVHIGARGCTLGGDLPARTQVLQRHAWMPMADLMALPADSPVRDNRDTAGVFYAQSWALTEMLVLAPEYGPRFRALIDALSSGREGSQALASIYGKSLDAITRDLRAWTAIKHQPALLPGSELDQISAPTSEEVPPLRARWLIADLLLASGELDRAEAIYRDLARETPQDAGVFAALGNIALRKGDKDGARQEWKRAIDRGIDDATLCYQYAALAEMAGLPEDELRPALERAVTLRPDFDDAHYRLALVEKNSGHYEAALANLRAMRNVTPARAFNYWIALADSLIQLDRREEARSASKRAMEHATTRDQRARAAQLAYFADTDLAVQFTSGENGRAELATTRVPHKTADWNPFIEPGDQLRHVEGVLREVDCSSAVTRFVVDTSDGPVTLAIPDPGHVQMRNAPTEFTCGPQKAASVVVDYAVSAMPGAKVDGLVRGMQFK
jgi:tetratricopeptide (TPR) repeat protein